MSCPLPMKAQHVCRAGRFAWQAVVMCIAPACSTNAEIGSNRYFALYPIAGEHDLNCVRLEQLDSPPARGAAPQFTPGEHDELWWERIRELDGARVVLRIAENGRVADLSFLDHGETAGALLLRDEMRGSFMGVGKKQGLVTSYCLLVRVRTNRLVEPGPGG